MKNLQSKVAVITGAASGIGRHLALQLTQHGAKVVAADFNETGLRETIEMIRQQGGEAFPQLVDVLKKEQIHQMADAVLGKYGHVDILINNAGVALGLISVEDVTYEEMEWIFGINLWGVIYGTKTFLPHLKTRPEAAIINISSVFGLLGVFKQAPYCITKFGVKGFTESLRAELLNSNILVMQVHPGGIKTNIARNARQSQNAEVDSRDLGNRFEENARTTPEQAAQIIIRGLQKGKTRVLVGKDAVWIDRLSRLFPNWAHRTFAKMSMRFERGGKFF